MPDQVMVYVVDDDEAVRDSLAFLLKSGGYQARTFASGTEALAAITPDAHGCVITDVRMPGLNGVELLRALHNRDHRLPVIVITGHGDVPLAVEAMKAGAADFLEKPFADELLLSAIERVLRPVAAQEPSNEIEARLARLSQRELQVLEGVVRGRLNKTIGYELGISIRTVEVYRAKLMVKMKADSFAELVRMAIQAGIGAD
jgi:two-component system response regulator FixJ